MLAFDSPQNGFESVVSYFNGLQELRSRSDAIQKMKLYTKSISTLKDSDQLDNVIANVIFENLKMK